MTRISAGTMTAAIFAILIGIGGAYAVRQYMHQPPAPAEQVSTPPTWVVPVAARDLLAGQKLSLDDVIVNRLSEEEFRKSSYADLAYMTNTSQIAGRTLNAPIAKGQVFEPTDFYPEGMGPGVAETLRPGYRAVSVPITDIGSVAGFARPGSIVDVLFRSDAQEDYPEMTMTLLERVEVLALDDTVLPDALPQDDAQQRGPAVVTLAVTPAQAKALKVVEGRGELALALRNPAEAEDELISLELKRTSARVTLDQLLGPAKRKTQMEIYRAGVKEILEFEEAAPESQFSEAIINTPIAADRRSIVEPAFKPMPLSGFPTTRNTSFGQ